MRLRLSRQAMWLAAVPAITSVPAAEGGRPYCPDGYRCFDACHRTQEARDFVFSDPRR